MEENEDREIILAADPGNPVFAAYCEELRSQGLLHEAIQVALKGLSHNPGCHLGRLILARCFYQLDYLPFARREIAELMAALPEIKSLRKLADKFDLPEPGAPDMAAKSEEAVLAEEEFDFGEIDLVAEELKTKGN